MEEQLDNLIALRLAERDRKRQFIIGRANSGERHTRLNKAWSRVLAVAAAVMVLVAICPMLLRQQPVTVSAPDYELFRGSASTVPELVAGGDYAGALAATRSALAELESTPAASLDPEETEYLLALRRADREELRWTEIYLLLQLNRRSEAKKALNEYLQNPAYQEHRAEAKAALQRM